MLSDNFTNRFFRLIPYHVYLLVSVLLPLDTLNPNNLLIIKHLQTHTVARGVQDDSPGHSLFTKYIHNQALTDTHCG